MQIHVIKPIFNDLHLGWIDLADEAFVINPGGCICSLQVNDITSSWYSGPDIVVFVVFFD